MEHYIDIMIISYVNNLFFFKAQLMLWVAGVATVSSGIYSVQLETVAASAVDSYLHGTSVTQMLVHHIKCTEPEDLLTYES